MEELPTAQLDIKTAYDTSDTTSLLTHVHKLHGACCYCGVPRLKHATATLETALKQKEEKLDDLITIFHQEVDKLLSEFRD